ncbi:hypothetical protein VTK73DRAFT_5441 [Phialemonium thermophilum]|uniref:Uncharacterized protein n=1 Tax=Phialemonium thermophilum TaxID=223376 RepID=A0ABR3V1S5_9PEZI
MFIDSLHKRPAEPSRPPLQQTASPPEERVTSAEKAAPFAQTTSRPCSPLPDTAPGSPTPALSNLPRSQSGASGADNRPPEQVEGIQRDKDVSVEDESLKGASRPSARNEPPHKRRRTSPQTLTRNARVGTKRRRQNPRSLAVGIDQARDDPRSTKPRQPPRVTRQKKQREKTRASLRLAGRPPDWGVT